MSSPGLANESARVAHAADIKLADGWRHDLLVDDETSFKRSDL